MVFPAPISTAQAGVGLHLVHSLQQAAADVHGDGVDWQVVYDDDTHITLALQAHALFAHVLRSGQHDHAVSGTHPPALRQHEDRVYLGFDQALAELCRQFRKGHDGIDQCLDIGLGPSTEAVQ